MGAPHAGDGAAFDLLWGSVRCLLPHLPGSVLYVSHPGGGDHARIQLGRGPGGCPSCVNPKTGNSRTCEEQSVLRIGHFKSVTQRSGHCALQGRVSTILPMQIFQGCLWVALRVHAKRLNPQHAGLPATGCSSPIKGLIHIQPGIHVTCGLQCHASCFSCLHSKSFEAA